MNLESKYLGYNLRSPFVLSASPIATDIDNLKRLDQHGIGAVVLHSLFEEQLVDEQFELDYHLTHGTDSFAEATSYFPNYDEFRLGPDEYLEHIRKVKSAINCPIIASLNGTSIGGWTNYAKDMQDAGADALELNIYNIPTDPNLPSVQIEDTYIRILQEVKKVVNIPVAVKLSPFFTNMSSVAKRFDDAGADALVLFNRFYQPDIDLNTYSVEPKITFSSSADNRMELRWIAILKNQIKANLAATGGIHTASDAIKMLLAGANVAQLFATLVKNGLDYLLVLNKELIGFMEEKGYNSVEEMVGVFSQKKLPNPGAYERAQYMHALTNYQLKL
jgi:dihydroorotate dehydrogenase (fumarate)